MQQFIDLVGVGPTLALVRALGGNVIKVPSRERSEGRLRARLIEIMGERAALLFIDRYAAETLAIARCAAAARDERDRRIIADYDAGQRVAMLAGKYILTERQIRTILKRSPRESAIGIEAGQVRQISLF